MRRFFKYTSWIIVFVCIFSLAGWLNSFTRSLNKSDINMMRDARGENAVVASAKSEASQAGIEIMKKGGNIIDAAVAAAFVLSVTEPDASGIGGGGFILIRFAKTGEEVFIDFRERAPENATRDMYQLDEDGGVINKEQTIGGKAVAVPGEVAGLLMVLDKYGTMSRGDVMGPAIDLAENGFVVTDNFAKIIRGEIEKIRKFDQTHRIYLKNNRPPRVGSLIKNPDLANTLKIIAKEGSDGFYKGEIAHDMVKTVRETGGILTLNDLANYEVRLRQPIKGSYRGFEIISAPPPSAGGIHILQLLNILENYKLEKLGHNTRETLHLWAESSKLMFADRDKYMADTDFVQPPIKGLISKDYARELSDKINLKISNKKIKSGDPYRYESGSTTHLSIMDRQGNVLAMTKTINNHFGSGVTVAGRGFLLNDEMDDFNLGMGGANFIEPGKRPLSNMTPTLLLKNGEAFLTLGSPGSSRIIPTVAQIISNIIDHKMDVQEAINAPRLFDRDGILTLEGKVDSYIIEGLGDMGHEICLKKYLDPYFGGVQCVILDESGLLHGGADPRRDGQALGY